MNRPWGSVEKELNQAREHLAGALRESYKLATREAKLLGAQLQKLNQRIRAEEKRLVSATQAWAEKGTESARKRADQARARIRELQGQVRALEKDIRPVMRELGLASDHLQKALGIDKAITLLQQQLGRKPARSAATPSAVKRPPTRRKKTTSRAKTAKTAKTRSSKSTVAATTGNGKTRTKKTTTRKKAAPRAKRAAPSKSTARSVTAKPAPTALITRSGPMPPEKL